MDANVQTTQTNWRDYYELTKPRVVILIVFTAIVGMFLSVPGLPDLAALFFGTLDRASVYPREILRRTLLLNAAAIIFAHNHPSGVPEPSASDIELTSNLKKLLLEIDVRVLDHLIIGRGSEVSLAERGLLFPAIGRLPVT